MSIKQVYGIFCFKKTHFRLIFELLRFTPSISSTDSRILILEYSYQNYWRLHCSDCCCHRADLEVEASWAGEGEAKLLRWQNQGASPIGLQLIGPEAKRNYLRERSFFFKKVLAFMLSITNSSSKRIQGVSYFGE